MRDKSGHGTFSGRGPAAIGRPVLLSPGLGYAGGGYASPLDVGGAMDDGKKFRDLVWIPDDEKVWRTAKKVADRECGSPRKLSSKNEDDSVWVHVPGKNIAIEVPKAQTHAYDPSHALDLDDASKMNQMHEAPLLDLLQRRFRKDSIYTNVADVLISVNPYKSIPLLYEVPLQQMQNEPNDEFEESDGEQEEPGEGRGRGSRVEDARPKALRNKLAKPHVFSVADRAFRYMKCPGEEYTHGKERGINQSIIISGESGAGKTEASKYVMRYLIAASQLAGVLSKDAEVDEKCAPPGGGTTAQRIEVTLLRSNTVLEAFGNAKTLRNDNSSRFGKYTKLLYNKACRLMGAWTDHFLLEKSRIAKVDNGERGYHVFYQLLAGLDKTTAAELLLAPPEQFFMISQGGCLTISDEVDDGQEFSQTDDAMGTLGFRQEDKAAIWRVLAALLHLSNVRFEENEARAHGEAKATASMWNSGLSSGESSDISSGHRGTSLASAAGMLGLDEETLTRKVTWRAIMAPGKSTHEIALTARESSDNLSALSKHTYGKLFSWIVAFINRCHHEHVEGLNKHPPAALPGGTPPPPGTASGAAFDECGNQLSFIGILDIFGFEIMATNSFEQLCINFANEVLQRQFNHQIFELEQEEYKAEGLNVAVIPFQNNEAIIDLICKKPLGLMIILEDQVLTGRKAHAKNKLDDRSVLDLYHQEHHRRNPHPNYEKPRMQCDQFILKHFAGSVTYDVAGFLEKNNDSLQDDLRVLLLDSEDPFVRELAEINNFPEEQLSHQQRRGSSSNSAQTQSVATRFSGVGCPLTPPPGGQGQVQRHPSFSQGRISRRGSERGCGLANATTVSSLFRRQLDSLVAQLGLTEPHYIKCIKPNSAKASSGWSCPLVMEQLRYSGVLEVVRIRREAFPLRLAYLELYRRFRFLAEWRSGGTPLPDECSEEVSRELCGEICSSALDTEEFQLGKTRVFLKDDALDKLRWALQAKYVSAACCIQAGWRAHADEVRRARNLSAALSLQAAIRGFVARGRWKRMRASLLLQAMARGFLGRRRHRRTLSQKAELIAREDARRAEEIRQKREAAQIKLSSVARAVIERERLEREACGATVLQASWRGYNARKALETSRAARRTLEGRRATKLQAWARMLLAGQARSRARRASTTLASAWRMRSEVVTKKKAIANVITVQALYRGMVARRCFAIELGRIVRIQKVLRSFVKRATFLKQVLSVRRLQLCVRAWLRNTRLRKLVMGVFGAARRRNAREVTKLVIEFPQLLFIRDRYGGSRQSDRDRGASCVKSSRCFSTLLHAACESGAMDVVVLLEPFPEDVTAVDLNGNSSVHVAASAVDYELVKHLSKRNNIDVAKALKEEKERSEHARRLSRRQVGASVNVFQAARLERAKWMAERCVGQSAATRGANGDGRLPKAKHALMAGYLRKRRETDRWLKRWCVLTETSLTYFHKPTDENPSKIIQLDKAMLKKSDKVDFAFEIHTPDLLDKKNKEGRLHFACTGEGELQKWLVPLRVVVALYQFRNDKRREPLVYLDTEKRARLVSMRNKRGETPLHVLAGTSLGNPANSVGTRGQPSVAVGLASPSGRNSVVSMQRLAAWLIESGADANQMDASGQTALHMAMECDNFSLVSTLVRKGGDVNLKRRCDGRSVITQVLEQGQGMDIIEQVSSERVTAENPLLPPPAKLFGFTYVSFFIEKTTFQACKSNAVIELTTPKSHAGASSTMARGIFDFQERGEGGGGAMAESPGETRGSPIKTVNPKSALSKWGNKIGHVVAAGVGVGGAGTVGGVGMGGWDSDRDSAPPLGSMTIDRVVEQLYFVRISVYNAKGNLSEAQQDVTVPIITTPEYLWWAHTWHMQTPLETLGAGSFVAFELKEKGERRERTISWGVYHLNPDEVNTRPESLCAYAGVPPALLRLEPSEFSLVGDAVITKFSISPTDTSTTATATNGPDAATSSARADSPANNNAG